MSIGGTPASEMKRSGIELAEAIRKRGRGTPASEMERSGIELAEAIRKRGSGTPASGIELASGPLSRIAGSARRTI